MQFKELSKGEFQKFIDGYDKANFWQSVETGNFREENGWKAFYVGVLNDDNVIAAALLTSCDLKFGFKAFEAPRGLYVDYLNFDLLKFFIDNIKKFCKSHKGLYFRMDPYFPLIERDINGDIVENGFDNHNVVDFLVNEGFKHFGYTRGDDNHFEPRWQFVLDVEGKTSQDILNEMDQKTRNQVNATKRKGIVVRELSMDEFDIFDDIMEHTSQRRHFENRHNDFYRRQKLAYKDMFKVKVAEMHTDLYLKNLAAAKQELEKERDHHASDYEKYPNHKKSLKKVNSLNEEIKQNEATQEKIKALAEKEGNVIVMAASFFVCYKEEVIYLYSGAYDKYLKYNPSVALQWEMINYAIDHHYKRYNFYGISGNFKPDEEGYGVYNFKKGFNGHVEELLGVFEVAVAPVKYKLYNLMKKVIGH